MALVLNKSWDQT